MTDKELAERRERIATAVLAGMYASHDPRLAREPVHVLALMAIDAADALVEELDNEEVRWDE